MKRKWLLPSAQKNVQANARFQRQRKEREEQMSRGEIEKSGLRKAFEQLGETQKQPTLRSFLNAV